MKKVFIISHKTRPVGHSVELVGDERDRGKHVWKALTMSELLKPALQEVAESESFCTFKRR